MKIAYHIPLASAVLAGIQPGWHTYTVVAGNGLPIDVRERMLTMTCQHGLPGAHRMAKAENVWNLQKEHPAYGADLVYVFEELNAARCNVHPEFIGCTSLQQLFENIRTVAAENKARDAAKAVLAAQILEQRQHVEHLEERLVTERQVLAQLEAEAAQV